MRIRQFIVLAGIALIAGCANNGDLSAPTSPRHQSVDAVAVQTTLAEIRVLNGELCPIDGLGRLLIFSGTATGPDDGSRLTVNGVEITPGLTFETGDQALLEDGFDCGGQHFDKAVHAVTEDIYVGD